MIKNWRHRPVNTESGQASMITVAMFMMLFAVVAVSFTYIVVSTTRQATNDTLQSSAKAAAESGVEDAKRLLVYCYSHSNGQGDYNGLSSQQVAMCNKVIGNKLDDLNCNDILSDVSASGLDGFTIEQDDQNGYLAKVGGDDGDADGTNNEYYQCLRIATMTTSYEGVINAGGSSVVVPLRLVDKDGNAATEVDEIIIKWHRNAVGEAGDQLVSGLTGGSGLPTAGTWNASGSNRPAVVRVERVGAAKSNVSINSLVSNDVAVTLRPSTGGASSLQMNTYKSSDTLPNNYSPNKGNAPIAEVKCNGNTSNPYACSITMTDTINLTGTDYYLRLNAIYKNAHFSIEVKNNGQTLYFNGVQPVVDVTGKSADAFNRVQAHLEPTYSNDDTNWWPEYAIDTDGKVCKDMDVFYDYGKDNCS